MLAPRWRFAPAPPFRRALARNALGLAAGLVLVASVFAAEPANPGQARRHAPVAEDDVVAAVMRLVDLPLPANLQEFPADLGPWFGWPLVVPAKNGVGSAGTLYFPDRPTVPALAMAIEPSGVYATVTAPPEVIAAGSGIETDCMTFDALSAALIAQGWQPHPGVHQFGTDAHFTKSVDGYRRLVGLMPRFGPPSPRTTVCLDTVSFAIVVRE